MYFIDLIQENAQMEVMDLTDKSDAESEPICSSIKVIEVIEIYKKISSSSFRSSRSFINMRLNSSSSLPLSLHDDSLSSSEEVEHSD